MDISSYIKKKLLVYILHRVVYSLTYCEETKIWKMSFFIWLTCTITKLLFILCPPIYTAIFSEPQHKRGLKMFLGFIGGFALGQIYYFYMLKKIPFQYHIGAILGLIISILLGIGNAKFIQLRCISVLSFPMYCGKAGRGVLKAIVLTYVVAGPITNMGLNAKEVVRVFACSTELSYNLSQTKYALIAGPIKKAVFGLKDDIGEINDALGYIGHVVGAIESEVEGEDELRLSRERIDFVDVLFGNSNRSNDIERKYMPNTRDKEKDLYQKMYLRKMEYRCEVLLSRAVAVCVKDFARAHRKCVHVTPPCAAAALCSPMKLSCACNVTNVFRTSDMCDSKTQTDPGLGEGYAYLKNIKTYLTRNSDVKLQYRVRNVKELIDVQDAKETGERVRHAFEEKYIIMRSAFIVINICMALLFLRIAIAAQYYHDMYLTSIEFDNVYITGYFKRIDRRRRTENKCILLPLKKMERNKYVDIHSVKYKPAERRKLMTQILKLMLEVVTATTFVMLDRLFYEALDMVRQYAQVQHTQQGTHDMEIEVKGSGVVARLVRNVLDELRSCISRNRTVSAEQCWPRARVMPPAFFLAIYGGYLWILLLLFVNPYTLRLRRLICSYFYPRREKRRILHLYNDILKKRMKMWKTLRRKAVQAARAHYLAGESLLSLRVRMPRLLGWLTILPAARMKCLICDDTEPRNDTIFFNDGWHSCAQTKCPFVYCPDCWREIGEHCLTCDPSLAELSDVDSLSEDEQPEY